MKICVTGASGFVGRHVVAELERRSIEVALMCFPGSGGHHVSAGRQVVELDIRQPPASVFEAVGSPDTLIHLAWGGLPNFRSLHHCEEELPAHYQFLKQLVREGLSSLFVAGTCAEYGLQAGALSEDMDPRPGHSYALAKHTLRLQLELLQSHMPFSLTWARLFFLYGDGQYHSALFSQLREAAESGAASFPMSGGEQLRDYLPVESVAELIVSLAVARRDFGCVNLCSGEPISVRRLVEGWIVENGWSITPELGVLAYPDYEPMACWGDRTRLDRCLSGTVPM